LFEPENKDDTAILHLSSLFGPDFKDEARCPATVGQIDRTSISLSRKTFARLDCYKFWLRRDCGMDFQSFSALLDAMLDEVLAADEKAAAFVKKHSGDS
jgi:hypothetical protein